MRHALSTVVLLVVAGVGLSGCDDVEPVTPPSKTTLDQGEKLGRDVQGQFGQHQSDTEDKLDGLLNGQ